MPSFVIGQAKASDPLVTFDIISSHKSVAPEQSFSIFLKFSIKKGWHIYGKERTDSGMPTQIQWILPKGITISSEKWSKPQISKNNGVLNSVYKKELMIQATAKVSAPLKIGQSVSIACLASWLACHEQCIPQKSKKEIQILVQKKSIINKSVINKSALSFFEKKSSQLPLLLILLFAFLGGLILNIMPCVLPVISLKMMSLIQKTDNKHSVRKEGLSFCLGIVLSFWILVSLLLLFRSFGHHYGWGFQMQSPIFLLSLLVLTFVFSLNMFGVCELGMSFTRLSSLKFFNLQNIQSFMNGFFATAVATPCTAPFMASAVGYALTQSFLVAFGVFTSLALGFSFPYLILSVWPELIKTLPKPGKWTFVFKQLMAFSLLGTSLWLFSIFSQHVDKNILVLTLIHLLLIAFFMWIHGQSHKKKTFFFLVLVICFSISSLVTNISSSHSQKQWIPFQKDSIQKYREEGRPVFVNCTAQWCVSCQWNKRMVLLKKSVVKIFQDNNVVLMEADWTKNDTHITQYLESFGVAGVPLYVYYPADLRKKPIVLPQILKSKLIVNLFTETSNRR